MYKVKMEMKKEGKVSGKNIKEAVVKIPGNLEVTEIKKIARDTYSYKAEKKDTATIDNLNQLHYLEKDGWEILSMKKTSDTKEVPDEEIDSSWIAGIDYDFDNQSLIVNTVSGNEYIYAEVPYTVYKSFLEAESAGRYFNKMVKGKFERKEG